MAQHKQGSKLGGDPVATLLGPEIQVVGRIEGREDLRVQGYVEGSIHLSEALILDNGGVIVGEVRVREAIIHGIVVGDVIASGRIILQPSARVVGDLKAPRVSITAGAALRGQVVMGESGDEGQQESGSGSGRSGRWRGGAGGGARGVSRGSAAPSRGPARVTRAPAARAAGVLARPSRQPEVVEEPGPRLPPQRPRPIVRESAQDRDRDREREVVRERDRDRDRDRDRERELVREREPAPPAVDEAELEAEAEAHGDEEIDVEDGMVTTSNGKKQAARPRVPARGKHSVDHA